jgi:uncharacterized protein (TIGR03437 family)
MKTFLAAAFLLAGCPYLRSQDALPVATAVVNTAGHNPIIAPNTWIEVHGSNLAPITMDWSAWDFSNGLPMALAGVSVTVNNKSAVVSYISPAQINVLTPLDAATGPVAVQVTNQFGKSAPFTVIEQSTSLGFLTIDTVGHVAARHLDYSLLGDASLSIPGYPFTPAKPGETVLLYTTGFGLTDPPMTSQTSLTGVLPTMPLVTVGGLPAFVTFAGVAAPGLYQFNVGLPLAAPNGDLTLSATYNGNRTQTGVVIAIKQ